MPPNRTSVSVNLPRNEINFSKKVDFYEKPRPITVSEDYNSVLNNGAWEKKGNVMVRTVKPGMMSEEAFIHEARKMFRTNKLVALYAVCAIDVPIKY